ncbi:hypothetical protein, partial [Mailhella massiliensis]
MRIFLFPFAVMLLLGCCLTGCLSEDRLDNVKVDGSMTTVIGTGSGYSRAGSQMQTGISF